MKSGQLMICAAVALNVLVIPGCYTLIPPPGVTVAERDESSTVNPDDFIVKSDAFPIYQATQVLELPPPLYFANEYTSKARMVAVEPTDAWEVTHRVGKRLLIFSSQYQQRQCRYVTELFRGTGNAGRIRSDGRCEFSPWLYYIFISEDGTVLGGWQALSNPERVSLSSNRRTTFNSETRRSEGWGAQPFFRVVPRKGSNK